VQASANEKRRRGGCLYVRNSYKDLIGLSFLLTGILLGHALVENFGAQIRL
jgi:hypothetical protein